MDRYRLIIVGSCAEWGGRNDERKGENEQYKKM